MPLPEARHLLIHGRVQGIGFRHGMMLEARRLGVSGWVRNRRNGTVEALIRGEAEAVAALLAWARRGPPGASVAQLAVEPAAPDGTSGFAQIADA